MRIYLDMCSIQRPMDDHAQPRVRLEAEAVLKILALCDSGEAELLDSDALRFEAERNHTRSAGASRKRRWRAQSRSFTPLHLSSSVPAAIFRAG
jgi:hypothetical protein